MPDVVFVRGDIPRFPRFRIAYVSEFAVTMNGMVAAPLQSVADRSLAGAGKTFDQVFLMPTLGIYNGDASKVSLKPPFRDASEGLRSPPPEKDP